MLGVRRVEGALLLLRFYSADLTVLRSSSVFYCGIDATVDEALRSMHEHQIRRLPVVDEQGRVLGIVVRSVLAQASRAAPDASAAREPLAGEPAAGPQTELR